MKQRSSHFLLGVALLTTVAGGTVAGATGASAPQKGAVTRRVRAISPKPEDEPRERWFKGNLHGHSLWSDGDALPEAVADWYQAAGYDFLALTEHDRLMAGERWMKVSSGVERAAPNHFADVAGRFGREWHATNGDDGEPKLRLKTLDEVRARLEKDGEFLLLRGEEITGHVGSAPAHVGAINLTRAIAPAAANTVAESLRRNVAAVFAQGQESDHPAVAIVNHPNFGFAVTASDLEASGAHFVEVFNGHPFTRSSGDGHHPSVERIWDVANTLRLSKGKHPVFGVAVDDAHAYHGRGNARPGRGWVMVRAERLEADTLVRALQHGSFYASSGVELSDVHFEVTTRTLTVKVAAKASARHRIQFIGTRRRALTGHLSERSPRIGETFSALDGESASYTMRDDDLYVRAVVVSSERASRAPRASREKARAWTQPVGWK